MKALSLTIAERLAAISIFNNPENKVPTTDLKVYLFDVDKFRLSEEDKLACKWEEIKNENGEVTSFKWDASAAEKSFEIEEFTRKFLHENLTKLEISAADPFAGPVATLIEKVC